jgi:hypothetical protein
VKEAKAMTDYRDETAYGQQAARHGCARADEYAEQTQKEEKQPGPANG